MSVELVTAASPEVLAGLNFLIPQLSSSAPPLTMEDLETLVAQDGVYLFVFRSKPEATDLGVAPILGTLTLATFVIPTGRRGWVEDVVVDQGARGQGAGQALVEAALEQARVANLKTVDLTTRSHREAANRLYVRCGFEQRETNIYRYSV